MNASAFERGNMTTPGDPTDGSPRLRCLELTGVERPFENLGNELALGVGIRFAIISIPQRKLALQPTILRGGFGMKKKVVSKPDMAPKLLGILAADI